MIIIMIIASIKHTHYRMETIFMKTKNSATNDPHKFKLDVTDKLNLKDPKKTWSLLI